MFEQSIDAGLHHRDKGFAIILLLVCAVASRFSSDPRVLLDPASPSSAGWVWFNQVHRQLFSKPLLARPCLSDLQMYCVSLNNKFESPLAEAPCMLTEPISFLYSSCKDLQHRVYAGP